MKASDIAYLAALVERAPSSHPRQKEILAELQDIYRATQGRRWGTPIARVPVQPDLTINSVVMEVEQG